MTLEPLRFSNGDILPPVGFGFWKVPKNICASMVVEAVKAGYRHFDCACDYGNEKEVGEGIRQAIALGLVARKDLWITSKLWNTYHAKEHVIPALRRSLADLGLEYLDLYLVHFPIALKYVPFDVRYPPEWVYNPTATDPKEKGMQFARVTHAETWSAMEFAVDAGLTRHIGVSNFNTALLTDLLNGARRAPEVLQVEIHPYNTQDKLLKFCRQNNVLVTCFSPLASASYTELNMSKASDSVLDQPVVKALAEKYQRSAAQIVLRWGVQRGTAVIPKTSQVSRLAPNLALFDFALSPEDSAQIDALNTNRRFNDPGVFCEGGMGTFCPIYD